MKHLVRIITFLCQLLVGFTFVLSGLSKVIDPIGTSIKLNEYFMHFGLQFLSNWSLLVAWIIAIGEFVLGFYMAIGFRRKLTLRVISFVMAIFTPLTLYLALKNPVDDCGCFGDVIVLSNWQTFAKNLVISAMIVWLIYHKRYTIRMLGRAAFTFYIYGVIAVAITLAAIGTWRLPYIDFRPFRPGVDLHTVLTSAEVSSDYYCIYERGNERKKFHLDSIPDESENWVFVEVCEPENTASPEDAGKEQFADLNFYALNIENEDVTKEIIEQEGYTLLLLSPNLREASEHYIDRIEILYEYAIENNYKFYCLTLNDSTAIEQWRLRTGAEYEMLFSDAAIIETMIRSNPGFMLLKDGVVLWKSHLADIDIEGLTSAKLSEHSLGQINPINRKNRVFWIILWLVAPLIVYLPLQVVKNFLLNKINKKKNEKENRCR
ncbi:MAG: DoxX family protein [Bacteroidales bacterium]|nr:DoxX family protein [Bacteroidales bacterium]